MPEHAIACVACAAFLPWGPRLANKLHQLLLTESVCTQALINFHFLADQSLSASRPHRCIEARQVLLNLKLCHLFYHSVATLHFIVMEATPEQDACQDDEWKAEENSARSELLEELFESVTTWHEKCFAVHCCDLVSEYLLIRVDPGSHSHIKEWCYSQHS